MTSTTDSCIVFVDVDGLSHRVLKAPCRIHPQCHSDLQCSQQGALSHIGGSRSFCSSSTIVKNIVTMMSYNFTASYISSGFFLSRNYAISLQIHP